jgi:probable rRNA maturation factor
VKIFIKNFQKKLTISPSRIKKAIRKTLACCGKKNSGEITVCVVDDKRIKALNLKFLRSNSATDVLSFNILGGNSREILGDIAISAQTAIRNAKIFNVLPSDELLLYVIHGTLHLLGYKDRTKKEQVRMHKKQAYIYSQIITCH